MINNDNIIVFLNGGVLGTIFTFISHPFHVLTTMYNREIIKDNIEPSLKNSIKYSLNFIKNKNLNQNINQLSKGISFRTLQGAITYSFMFSLRNYFDKKISDENNTIKNIKISAYSGYIENIVRQPFLTITSSYINGDNIYNSKLWLNIIKSYPITSLIRSMYFTSSTIGNTIGSSIIESSNIDNKYKKIFSGLFGIGFCIRFNGFSESFTNALSSGQNLNACFKK